jgi:PEGA domain
VITSRWTVSVLLLLTFRAIAQGPTVAASTESKDGLTTLVFQTPMGVIRANFPGDLAAGDTISGTVTDEPAGTTPEERNANSATLSGYVIDTGNRQTTPRDHRATWLIPPAVTTITVLLRNRPGGPQVGQGVVPVAPPAIPDPSNQAITGNDFDLPTIGQESRTYPINGRFTGDSSNTTVSVGGKPAEVLAESPRRAYFTPPAGVSGSSRIELHEGNVTVTGEFRTLIVQLRGDTNLIKNQTAPLVITVGGLAGGTQPVDMTLENRSPGVVLVSGGPVQNFRIAPQEVTPAGLYTTTRTMTGVMRGRFDISAFVRQWPLDRLDPRQTVARALQQWQANNGIPITSDAQILIARSVLAARDDLNRLLDAQGSQSDPQALLSSLVRSYCFQLRDYKTGVLTGSAPGRAAALFRPPFAFAFQATTAVTAQAITDQDVAQHSFLSYLSDLVSSLSGTMQLSPLAVCSVPDAALIIIDGKRVGATTSSFVVSKGQHQVEIQVPGKACRIKANAGQDVVVSCPKTVVCNPRK